MSPKEKEIRAKWQSEIDYQMQRSDRSSLGRIALGRTLNDIYTRMDNEFHRERRKAASRFITRGRDYR